MLRKIYEATAERLSRRREPLPQLEIPDELPVAFVGSWGRHEVTSLSDNNYYLLTRTNEPLAVDGLEGLVTDALIDEEAEFTAHDRRARVVNANLAAASS